MNHETADHLSTDEWESIGRAAAAEGVSTGTVRTVVGAFLTSQKFPDADDNDLRTFFGPNWKEEVAYADRALKWLYQHAPSDRIKGASSHASPGLGRARARRA